MYPHHPANDALGNKTAMIRRRQRYRSLSFTLSQAKTIEAVLSIACFFTTTSQSSIVSIPKKKLPKKPRWQLTLNRCHKQAPNTKCQSSCFCHAVGPTFLQWPFSVLYGIGKIMQVLIKEETHAIISKFSLILIGFLISNFVKISCI